jgi:hypothetical protein
MNYKVVVTAVVAGLLAANGVLRIVDDSVAGQVVGLLAALGLYLLPSPLQRGGDGGPPAGRGWPGVLPLVAAALLLAPAPARAQLPWRRQMEQRLQQMQQQLNALQQHAAPAPQPPQIIVVPQPYQTLPISGEPRQQLPIAGDPKQQLPIRGAPRQQLPVPGGPRQQLPVPGSPWQQLPIQGPIQERLPGDDLRALPGPAPTPFTRALWR